MSPNPLVDKDLVVETYIREPVVAMELKFGLRGTKNVSKIQAV